MDTTVLGFFLLLFFGKNGPAGKFLMNYFEINIIFSWTATVIAAVVVAIAGIIFPAINFTLKLSTS